jgi:hypothetical protein
VAAERAQRLGENGGAGHAVAVVVAENHDALLLADRTGDTLGGGLAVEHRVRRGELGQARVQEPSRRLGLAMAARFQPARDRDADAQRAAERLRSQAGGRRKAFWR